MALPALPALTRRSHRELSSSRLSSPYLTRDGERTDGERTVVRRIQGHRDGWGVTADRDPHTETEIETNTVIHW